MPQSMQGASSGAAVFSADGAGRPGMVTFSPPAPPVGEEQPAATASVRFADAGAGKSGCARFSNAAVDLHSISDESLQAAFEVLVGRLQSADLTGIGFPEEHFAEASCAPAFIKSAAPTAKSALAGGCEG